MARIAALTSRGRSWSGTEDESSGPAVAPLPTQATEIGGEDRVPSPPNSDHGPESVPPWLPSH